MIMSQKTFNLLVGLIFLAVAIMHLWRIINDTPVIFGDINIPIWVSWGGIVVAGYLSYHGLTKR